MYRKEYVNEVEKNGGNGASAIADEIINKTFYAPTVQEQQGGMLVVPTQQEQVIQNNNIPLLQGRVETNVPLSTDNLIQQIAPNTYEKQKGNSKTEQVDNKNNKYNDLNETSLKTFYNKHQNLSEKEPQEYTGSRTFSNVLKYLGSKDNNTAKIKTPIEEVIFNRNNLAHLITQNEESRLSNLNKVVRTLQAPNLIVQNVENGSEYKYYIKSFEKDGKQKGHLQVIKCKPDGNFYVTNYPLRNDKFSRIINNGQIIYDLSDQPAIQNIVSDNNIITNEKTTFNPTETQTNETIRQVAPKTAEKQGLVEEKPKVKNKNSIMTYKNDLDPINENENFYTDYNYIVKKDYFELKGQGKKIKASPEFDNDINKLYKEFDENFTFNKATVTDNVTYKNATKPIAVTLEYTNNKGEQKKTFLTSDYKKQFKGYSFDVSNEVHNGHPIIKITDNGETVGYVASFVPDENKIKIDHIDQTDDMVKTAEKVEEEQTLKTKKGTYYNKAKIKHEFEYVDEPPKGWVKEEMATTAPNGFTWYSNGKSVLSGEKKVFS